MMKKKLIAGMVLAGAVIGGGLLMVAQAESDAIRPRGPTANGRTETAATLYNIKASKDAGETITGDWTFDPDSTTATQFDHGVQITAGSLVFPSLTPGILATNVGGTSLASPFGSFTNGQLLIGDGDAFPTVAALTGTANQVTVTNGSGSITLALPQNIHTAADPTFNDLSLTGGLSLDSGQSVAWGSTDAILSHNGLVGGVALLIVDDAENFLVTDVSLNAQLTVGADDGIQFYGGITRGMPKSFLGVIPNGETITDDAFLWDEGFVQFDGADIGNKRRVSGSIMEIEGYVIADPTGSDGTIDVYVYAGGSAISDAATAVSQVTTSGAGVYHLPKTIFTRGDAPYDGDDLLSVFVDFNTFAGELQGARIQITEQQNSTQ